MDVVWRLIEGFRGLLTIATVLSAALFYDLLVDDPLLERRIRKEQTVLTQKDALLAQMEELKRQKRAAETALAGLRKEFEQLSATEQDIRKRLEEEQRYAEQLRMAGRACLLDDSDIEWLRRN